jgi:hypothetical protein
MRDLLACCLCEASGAHVWTGLFDALRPQFTARGSGVQIPSAQASFRRSAPQRGAARLTTFSGSVEPTARGTAAAGAASGCSVA